MEFAILDEKGTRVGELRMSIYATGDTEGLNERFKRCNGFGFFLRQLPTSAVYPFAEVDFEIHHNKRKRGYGRRALKAFTSLAMSKAAKWGFLRVATQGEDYETGVQWRNDFYRSEGWKDFLPLPNDDYWPRFMFNLFGATALANGEFETVLLELDEFDEFSRIMDGVRQKTKRE